ncbi:HD domain-containing protein [Bradyrhizobium sp. 174]|uniref:HD domain-containing protein n=1 Tax=Bradyrhizobium sp. 174 TaxID=2782645 RepID=UPI001FF945A7|nr:HD domain-containing protein [Bradyrhizobium sp. 174]
MAIAKLELGPGDVLVVQSKNRVPQDVLDRIKTYVEPQLPHGVKILVIDPSVTLSSDYNRHREPDVMSDLINRAREFARAKHAEQLRNYTGLPYFTHLEEVAGLVERAGLSEFAVAAAWLHDSVEDTDTTVAEVTSLFGMAVAILVNVLTDTPPAEGLNRDRRKAMDRARLAIAPWEAQGIKCADLVSNTSTIVKHDPGFAKRYLPEKRAILEVLTRAPPALRDPAWASLIDAERQLEAPPDAPSR